MKYGTQRASFDLSGASTCVACGLCLPHCPTYALTRTEGASPRGRLALMRGLATGDLAPSPRVAQLLGRCLECRACETACPSNVPFGAVMEDARAQLRQALPSSLLVRWVEQTVLEGCFARPWRLGALARALDIVHGLGLVRLARRLSDLGLFPEPLAVRAEMLPRPDGPPALGQGPVVQARLPERGTVALLTGCVADVYLTEVNRATIAVLTAAGFRVLIPPNQRCCGALHLHRGMRDQARSLAAENVRAFAGLNVDAIVTNSAGCGSTLVEYDAMVPGADGDRRSGPGAAFAAKVRDVTEFLAQRGLPRLRPVAARVTYDDPCHLIHARHVREAPRQVLRQIPGIEFVEAPHADTCCGSAGLYSVTHPDASLAILSTKIDALLSVDPAIVTTANPGCLLHLRLGIKRRAAPVQVLHVIELLARALAP